MCGLAFAFSKRGKSAAQQVYQLYQNQATRGKQGYGFLSIHNGKLVSIVRAKDEIGIRTAIMKDKSELIMFHHRWPTSTKNTIGTTHPMFISNKELKYDYYFAHNGVIGNATYLKGEHEKLGYSYLTELTEKTICEYKNGTTEVMSTDKTVFNDSESLAIELARHLEGLSDKIDTRGPAAFWGISLKKGTNEVVDVFFGKNKGRDLCVKDNSKWFSVSSETGQDIRDMVLFSVPIKQIGSQLFEQPLLIDEATPIVRTATNLLSERSSVGFSDVNKIHTDEVSHQIGSYDDELVNAYYTIKDVYASGFAFSAFSPTTYKMMPCYLPNQFLGIGLETRVFLKDYEPKPRQINIPSVKEMEELEELAEKYISVETRMERVEQRYENSEITKYQCENAIKALQNESDSLEELIASTGIDTETIEKTLEDFREIADYNSTYTSSAENDINEQAIKDVTDALNDDWQLSHGIS